jgi:hypothetical protein
VIIGSTIADEPVFFSGSRRPDAETAARIARDRALVDAFARYASASAGYGEISWN